MGTPKGCGKTAPWRAQLRTAADYLKKHGMCQLKPTGFDGQICMNEAIARAVAGDDQRPVYWNESKAARAFRDHVLPAKKGSGDVIGDVCDWNNAKGRTTADGVAALRAAAEAR